jgi:hypothetical protein
VYVFSKKVVKFFCWFDGKGIRLIKMQDIPSLCVAMKILFSIVFLFFCSLYAKPLQIDVKAQTAVLMNAETGVFYLRKNLTHAPSQLASRKSPTALYYWMLNGLRCLNY